MGVSIRNWLFGVGALVALSGCSMQKMAGDAVLEYSHDVAVPYLISQGDLESACAMGQAMGPVLTSFGKIELDPARVGIGTQMAAGMCAEFSQRSDELSRYRALFENRGAEAQDALIREKQNHRLAAQRMIIAYENAVSSYGDLSESCPRFENSTDALLSLLGLASGALAILHDFNSEKSVGISLDIPGKIESGAQCFDDEKWWGMPTALRAAIWLSIPGSGPEGVNPLAKMDEAAKIGDEKGVFLARAMYVMMAATVGDFETMCRAMASWDTTHENAEYAMLNAYARGMIQHQADIAWTKKNGYRAPFMTAECPTDSAASHMDEARVDDLLDGLLEEEETEVSHAISAPSENLAPDASPSESEVAPESENRVSSTTRKRARRAKVAPKSENRLYIPMF